jgi:prephenate dehydrogenase
LLSECVPIGAIAAVVLPIAAVLIKLVAVPDVIPIVAAAVVTSALNATGREMTVSVTHPLAGTVAIRYVPPVIAAELAAISAAVSRMTSVYGLFSLFDNFGIIIFLFCYY